MQIKQYGQAAEIEGIEAAAFGFEMNAKMYDILISKLYKNKPGAVIRELAANAWDAHVEANNLVPFDIHLPTWLDKTFKLRDYGTGIPHDSFENIYTNVGSSTKEDTNEFIGGFGLGSKTPFTMTDTFMVENINNGIKTTWICFKDSGVPSVTKVSEEPTNEHSGLQVSFSFDDGDVDEFTKQIVKQLKFFPVKPNITGGERKIVFPDLPDDWETKDYFYMEQERHSYNRRHYVVMGNVAYDIHQHDFADKYYNVFNKGLVIKVNIGDVDIPPSRENLELTPKTKTAIEAKLEVIRETYNKDARESMSKAKNLFELKQIACTVNTSFFNRDDEIKFQGETYRVKHLASSNYLGRIGSYTVQSPAPKGRRTMLVTSSLWLSDYAKKQHKLIIMDLHPNGKIKHFKANMDKLRDKGEEDFKIYIFTPWDVTKAGVTQSAAQCKKEIEDTTGAKCYLLSDLIGQTPKPTKGSGAKRLEPNQVFKFESRGYDSTQKCSVEEDAIPKNGYVLRMSQWSLLDTNLNRLKGMVLYGELKEPVYFVRLKTFDKLKIDGKNLKGYDQLVKDAQVGILRNYEAALRQDAYNQFYPQGIRVIGELVRDKEVDTKGTDDTVHLLVQSYLRTYRVGGLYNVHHLKGMLDTLPKVTTYSVPQRLQKLAQEYEQGLGLIMKHNSGWNSKRITIALLEHLRKIK